MIRPARPADREAVEAIVRAAYSVYIGRIGKSPGPMLDDYAQLIGEGCVSVFEADQEIVALIVLISGPDGLLVDNIAVRPDRQGHGLGRQLMSFAESEAVRRGLNELRLYTHVTMTENVALYRRLGFAETGRGHQNGYERVFMRKPLI